MEWLASLIKEKFKENTELDTVDAGTPLLIFLVSYVIAFVGMLFLLKFLWNTVLVKVVPAVKPIDSMLQLIGLIILVKFFHR